jgi:DNA processing protein
MISEQHFYAIALSMIDGIGSVNAKKLIAYVGSIEGIFKEKKKNLTKIPGIGEVSAGEIYKADSLKAAENEIAFIEKNNIHTYFYLDENYPLRLKQCYDAPIILFEKGKSLLNEEKIISIVGTRNATDYGRDCCEKIIQKIVERKHNVLIVSGLAYGIDITAHRAALHNKLNTVAVLGHGLQTIYPAVHAGYARDIEEQGALVTEFTTRSKMDKALFVRRNRIIAGLSDATLVIESAAKGGALITAEIANAYDREVFAIPGRLSDSYSQGCNRLIAQNKARILLSAEDLEEALSWRKANEKPRIIQTELFNDLSEEENLILGIIRNHGETPIDLISIESQIPIHKVSAALLNLEFSGLIKCLPGKIYKIL